MVSVAIIFTCFNRIDKTKECILGLLRQKNIDNVKLTFYICDDKSTDGTVEMINKYLPQAKIFISDGNLYWSKGMHCAMQMAYADKADYYLMINDDLNLQDNAISIMLDSYKKVGKACGIVGTTFEELSDIASYGGRKYYNKAKVGRNELLMPNITPVECDIANWNCFLVPKEVIDKIGVVDSKYEHGLGDFDYCWMMKRAGYSVYIATDYVGRTNRNSIEQTYLDEKLDKKTRLKKLFSIKGRPWRSELYFYKKNHGIRGYFYFSYFYCKLILGILI